MYARRQGPTVAVGEDRHRGVTGVARHPAAGSSVTHRHWEALMLAIISFQAAAGSLAWPLMMFTSVAPQ